MFSRFQSYLSGCVEVIIHFTLIIFLQNPLFVPIPAGLANWSSPGYLFTNNLTVLLSPSWCFHRIPVDRFRNLCVSSEKANFRYVFERVRWRCDALPTISASCEYPPSIIFAAAPPLYRSSTGRNRSQKGWLVPPLAPPHAARPPVEHLREDFGDGILTLRSKERGWRDVRWWWRWCRIWECVAGGKETY